MTRAGFTLSRACSEKMWGSSPGQQALFFLEKTGDLFYFLAITVRVSAVSSPEKPATFFGRQCRFYLLHSFTRVSPPLFLACKKNAGCRSSCGAPFCGGPCSAEHAEHA